MARISEDVPGRPGVHIFACGTNPGKCHYCSRRATARCEQPIAGDALPGDPEGHPCGRPICGQCTKHGVCRIHPAAPETP